jgi:hypothetical protein
MPDQLPDLARRRRVRVVRWPFYERGRHMNTVDQALATQLKNIQTRTGKTLDELYGLIRKSGLTKHGEIVALLKRDLGIGHGDANRLALTFLKSVGEQAAPIVELNTSDVVTALYAGSKTELLPIHEKLMGAVARFGPFEIAPKKGYISLRRKKQFAMIGPAAKTRLEVGLNMKGVKPTVRLVALPEGGMCQYKVHITDVKEVDKELIAWLRLAYDSAG